MNDLLKVNGKDNRRVDSSILVMSFVNDFELSFDFQYYFTLILTEIVHNFRSYTLLLPEDAGWIISEILYIYEVNTYLLVKMKLLVIIFILKHYY